MVVHIYFLGLFIQEITQHKYTLSAVGDIILCKTHASLELFKLGLEDLNLVWEHNKLFLHAACIVFLL